MEFIMTIITPLVIGFGAFVIFALARRENRRKNEKLNRHNFVARSTYTWGAVMVTVIVLLLLLVIFGNIGEPFGVGLNVALSLLILALGFGSLQIFREKVTVKENEIIFTPAIGKKKAYRFQQIERVENRKTGVCVFINGKKVFTLDPSGIGTALFVEIYKTREL